MSAAISPGVAHHQLDGNEDGGDSQLTKGEPLHLQLRPDTLVVILPARSCESFLVPQSAGLHRGRPDMHLRWPVLQVWQKKRPCPAGSSLHYQTGKNLLLCFCIRGNRVATCSRIVGSPGASIILIVPWRVGRQLAHFTMTPSLWHVLRLAIDFGTELKAANAEWSLHSLKKCFKIIQVRMSGRSAAW